MPELDDIEQLFALKEFKKACDDALQNSCMFMPRVSVSSCTRISLQSIRTRCGRRGDDR